MKSPIASLTSLDDQTNTKVVMKKSYKPHLAMLFVQLVYSGMALFSKLAVSQGIKPFVFVFYRQALATLALAPFAFFLDSGKSSPLTFIILVKMFFTSLCGLTLGVNLYYVALNYTTATFAAATTNLVPAITFIIALLFRLETVSLRKSHGMAKVFGSIVGVCGAIVFAFAKGPSLNHKQSTKTNNVVSAHSTQDWIKGAFIMLSANTAWCLWLNLQTIMLKEYSAKLRSVTLQLFFTCIQTAFWAIAIDRNPATWKLQFGLPLLSVIYCGIVVTGITYWMQVWAIGKKGPVFTAMFTPLALLITSIVSSFLFKETLYLGSVGGGVLLVSGLYSVLWGKNKEETEDIGETQTHQTKDEQHISLDFITTTHH